ncbi:MAG TPA: 50S ribosomal protein L11 methyltransferase [Vicinamibacterales bacterium]|nr:50S ribosomal protein L11 methyltransferase [Vicinamibacterales bacterium]
MTAPALDLQFPAGGDHPGDLVSAELQDLSPTAIHELDESGMVWRVFFSSASTRDQARRVLTQRFGSDGIVISPIDVPDENWAARSQANLRHIRIGRIIVAPPWDVPQPVGGDELLVVIRPSTGFGTGHHATTRLGLRLLQDMDCAGKRVTDVGTGSGVLAIAAARLGAADVLGIDVDPDALENARENVELNGADLPIRLVQADGREPQRPADIVCANLTGAALTASASALIAQTVPGGRLMLSGFQHHECEAVLGAFGPASCENVETEEEWVAAVVRV